MSVISCFRMLMNTEQNFCLTTWTSLFMHNTRDIATEEGMQIEKHTSRQILVKLVSVQWLCTPWFSLNTHLLVKVFSVNRWNCLCCVGCCHCWPISWTSVSFAFSVRQAWTAASWAALSSATSLASHQGLTLPWQPCRCWHHRSTCAWPLPRQRRGGSHCHCSAGPCRRLPRQAAGALAESQTEVELDRDMERREFRFQTSSVKSWVSSHSTKISNLEQLKERLRKTWIKRHIGTTERTACSLKHIQMHPNASKGRSGLL